MTDEITALLDLWDRTVVPLMVAADDARDTAETDMRGSWGRADELMADCNEAMASLGQDAIELLRRIKEGRDAQQH